ncbi:TrmB family transcriptional regulator [Halobacteriales archaeon QS_1_68_17]|nr:MAG: TrmB family transcriptional regulator [Halobacteriales archaeon QS_1_68_17]
MDSDTLVESLQEAGLSPYQAEAYVGLLEMGSASASELADASQIPKPRIYDVLESLERRGYIETYEQDTLRARAHDLDDVLGDLESRIGRLEAAAEEIEHRWTQPNVESHEVSIVSRSETVHKRAEAAIESAEYHLQLSVSPAEFRTLKPLLSAAHDRGVQIEISLHTRRDEPQEIDPGEFEGAATEVRHRNLPAPFVVLVDRKQVCFATHETATEEYGILVDDRMLAYVFHWHFLTSLWEVWDPIYQDSDDTPPAHYAEIRKCVRDIEPLVRDGSAVQARVEGVETDTGRERTLSGRIVDIEYSAETNGEGPPSLLDLAGQATLVLETDEETYSVGGQGALVEDIRANRITILDPTPDRRGQK